VDIGQLIFIGVVLGALSIIRHLGVPPRIRHATAPVTTYAIGIMAAFWFIERLVGFGS
jgi:hypothetical protein